MTLSQPDFRIGVIPLEWEAGRFYLQERLRAMEGVLEDLQSTLLYGPIPGAYFNVSLSYSGTIPAPPVPVALSGISFEAVPVAVYLTVFGAGATVTLQVRNSTTDILAVNQAVSTGTPVTLNERSDFAVDRVYAPDLNLYVVSVDAGTPIHVFATVILKNVQKVEPA